MLLDFDDELILKKLSTTQLITGLLMKNYPLEHLIHEIKQESRTFKIRPMVYSYDFVDSCVALIENDVSYKDEHLDILAKCNLVEVNKLSSTVKLSDEFKHIMYEGQIDDGYDFNFIQDEIYYTLFPDLR
jgi:hypothetical protein